MDPTFLALIAVVVLVLAILLYLNKSKSDKKEENQFARPNGQPAARNLNPNLPRNLQRNRLRNRNRPVGGQNRNDDDDEGGVDIGNRNVPIARARVDDDDDNEEIGPVDEMYTEEDREELRRKLGTKKLAKLEEKAARRERNEAMLREREEKRELDEKLYQERKKKEQEAERIEKEKELLEKKAKEEQEKREHEEYMKLKEAFTVDEEGVDVDESNLDSENLLNMFVNFIKNSKIVVLEDLAAEFKLKTQDAINRINQVQEMGLLTGVMDDRGKFIYISEEELLKVKKFIEQRGRVNIGELAKSSNELINLKPMVKEAVEDLVESNA